MNITKVGTSLPWLIKMIEENKLIFEDAHYYALLETMKKYPEKPIKDY